ncbi:MAG: tripartite tricarboxylate transporter substrate binding protein [Rhizobacter sp.]|nr:tripartite tricarboxylate transporter substrate binding protein [Burkholderiales bacterium]
MVAAAAYPDKPIRLIVTFAPGGASDIVARTISEPLGQKLGQPVIVDNRPGAGGSVGGLATVQAAPDGYTLMMANSTPLSIGPFVLDKQPYDPVKQFSHVFYAGSAPVLFMASPKAGIDSLAGLAKLAASPNGTPFGSGGPASIGHISGEFFNAMAKGRMLHVAYKGGAPMTTDLLGGQIPVGIDVITAFVPLVKSGQLKALAVTSAKRSPLLPDVPTTAEAGYPKLRIDNYFGVSGPAGLPKEVTDKLYAALAEVLTMPNVLKKLEENGIVYNQMTQAEYAALVANQIADWAPIIKATGTKL